MNDNYYSPQKFSILPPVVKNLLIINGLFFLATIGFQRTMHIDLYDILGLHYFESEKFHPYQFITYMFMHGDLGHLFFNMFALWMFGSAIENYWGGKRFLIYYLLTGLGAGLTHYGVLMWQLAPQLQYIDACIANPDANTVQALLQHHQFRQDLLVDSAAFKENLYNIQMGYNVNEAKTYINNYLIDYREALVGGYNIVGASGSVFGLLLAFGMMFPNSLIFIYFLFPIKAKWFVVLYGALELFYGITGTADGIAHFAHLGGMVFGLLIILYWKKKGTLYN